MGRQLYTIAFAAFILTAGALGDRIGAKRIFMAGFAIFNLVAARVTERIGAPATIAIGGRAVGARMSCAAWLDPAPATGKSAASDDHRPGLGLLCHR